MSRHFFAVVGLTLALGACAEDPKLKVTGLDPEKGDVDGGTYVVIKGNRFTADGPRNVRVYFGGKAGNFIRFINDGELVVQAPPGRPNEKVDVLVHFEPGGEIKIKSGFTFVEKRDAPRIDDLDTSGKKKGAPAPKK
jgi:hypothetical protein